MKKKILFMSTMLVFLVLAIIPKSVSALNLDTRVDGTIIIRWIDYGDPRNERPESINLVVGERLSSNMQHQTITLNKDDAIISPDPENEDIVEWKFTKSGYNNYFFTHHGEINFLYEYTEIENLKALGYNELDSEISGAMYPTKYDLNGHAIEDAGTLIVTLVKDTLVTKKLTVIYNDSNARDNNYLRNLDFAIRGKNVLDPIQSNAYYRFNITSENTIKKNSYVDKYTKNIYVSGSDAYQSGVPIIDYVFEEDTKNLSGRNITYQMDGDNIIVTVNYQAKTKQVPIEIEWKDYDNQLGLRPAELLVKAYDQKGNLEKELTLAAINNWLTTETLYENMIYSNGTPIEYTIELAKNDDYEFTVTKAKDSYKIIAKLKNEDGIVLPPEDEIVKNETAVIEENPNTVDSVVKYISMFLVSFISLLFIAIVGIKRKKKINI